jgi:hypothetical protein
MRLHSHGATIYVHSDTRWGPCVGCSGLFLSRHVSLTISGVPRVRGFGTLVHTDHVANIMYTRDTRVSNPPPPPAIPEVLTIYGRVIQFGGCTPLLVVTHYNRIRVSVPYYRRQAPCCSCCLCCTKNCCDKICIFFADHVLLPYIVLGPILSGTSVATTSNLVRPPCLY